MKPEESLRHSQEPATEICLEVAESCPDFLTLLLKMHFNRLSSHLHLGLPVLISYQSFRFQNPTWHFVRS